MTGSTTADRFAAARAIADTVLYEGYVLYPYRASAAKNQVRWQFGVLAPEAVAATAGERSSCRAECLLELAGGGAATLDVRARFLQVEARQVQAATHDGFTPVAALEAGGRIHTTFEGGLEHEVDVEVTVDRGTGSAVLTTDLPGRTDAEPVLDDDGRLAGRTVSERRALRLTVRVDVTPVGEGPHAKVTVEVVNATAWRGAAAPDRFLLVREALVGVHVLVAVRGDARFVSLLDPPRDAASAAEGCVSEGTYPVLVGHSGEEVVLSAPIVLPEHPEVAPESAGDFCDATEIDEILALRVLTLTDEEKREARATDPRAAAIVDRCDGLPEELLSRLHGAIRSLRPAAGAEGLRPGTDPFPVLTTPSDDPDDRNDQDDWDEGDRPWWDPAVDGAVDPWSDTLEIEGVAVGKGAKVRLRPGRRADAQDLFVAGLEATVQGVFSDVDGDTHVAVTVDADPGAEMSAWHGRFLYFHPDEVEPMGGSS